MRAMLLFERYRSSRRASSASTSGGLGWARATAGVPHQKTATSTIKWAIGCRDGRLRPVHRSEHNVHASDEPGCGRRLVGWELFAGGAKESPARLDTGDSSAFKRLASPLLKPRHDRQGRDDEEGWGVPAGGRFVRRRQGHGRARLRVRARHRQSCRRWWALLPIVTSATRSATLSRPPSLIAVSEVMSHPVRACFPDEAPTTVLVTMGKHRVRRLPVLDKKTGRLARGAIRLMMSFWRRGAEAHRQARISSTH